MARDMHELAAKAQAIKPHGYDLSLSEVTELLTKARSANKEDTLQAISEAFNYGFALGCRASQNGKVKHV